MEGFIVWAVILILGYPIFVSCVVTSRSKNRLDRLESEVNKMARSIEELRRQAAGRQEQASTVVSLEQQTASSADLAPATPVVRAPDSVDRGAPPAPAAVDRGAPPAPAWRVGEPSAPAVPAPAAGQGATRSDKGVAAATSAPLPSVPEQPFAPEGSGEAPPAPPPIVAPRPPRVPVEQTPAWVLAAKRWLFSGNLLVKLGLLILFIGVSFLLKYAAERVVIPLEVRLACVVLADLALLVWGWRIRLVRREVALPVQGAALAILMLVTFGAYQRFHLIPGGFAFAMLVTLTVFTCVLAVLQDAVWLAAFGIAGGFASPILVSTGQGNHIGLFSYYAVLNAGIFAIGLKRAWRSLNLLGFAFTFLIGTAWGVLKYVPANYPSAQAFLILFFLFYVAIAVAYANRQAPRLKHYVDATLVFGTPMLAFALQYGLVKDKPFGLAFSALALGGFYLALALALWKRHRDNWRLLVESFLSLGVVFATLALPFALDGRWTSAAWALEGAALVWMGLRQGQPRTWIFGLLVQAGAWMSFIGAISGLDAYAARQSNLWLGFLLLAASTFGMATNFHKQQDAEGRARFTRFANGFLALAALWLLAGGWTEIILRNSGMRLGNLLVASAFGTAAILSLIAARLEWQLARRYALAAQLAGGGALSLVVALEWNWTKLPDVGIETPLVGAFLIAAGALFTSWSMQRVLPEQAEKKTTVGLLLWSGFWWFGPILNLVSGLVVRYTLGERVPQFAWWGASYDLCLAASALAFAWLARRLAWPSLRWFTATCWGLLAWVTLNTLRALYVDEVLPGIETWIAYGALWLCGDYLLRFWPASTWNIGSRQMQLLHALRSAGPWLGIWPAGAILVSRWLHGSAEQQAVVAQAGWQISGSWANFLPAWAMMLAIVWLIKRSRAEAWPTTPVSAWYRQFLIPCATLWALLLAAAWNLTQNGAMAPLPYLPVLNPLDLTTGFAMLLAVVSYRMVAADMQRPAAQQMLKKMRFGAALAAYAWFNLMLLRTAAHYLDIPYRIDDLVASQFVEAMLSLVWSGTALVLMRYAATRMLRQQWVLGAVLLVLVVAKLFIADLSNVGSMARIISFVGVGLLMLLIGYLAPYPKQGEAGQGAAPAHVE